MGLKRSRSCDDHGEVLCGAKRRRRSASDLPLGIKHTLPHLDLVDPSRQAGDSEHGRVCDPHGKAGIRDHEKIQTAAPTSSTEKVIRGSPKTLSTPIASWIEGLPKAPSDFAAMSQTPSKRPRSDSGASLQLSDCDSGNEARRGRGDLYKDPRYDTLLESNGAFLKQSLEGPLPDEITYCRDVLCNDAAETKFEPKDAIFDGNFLQPYIDLMQASSELRLCIDLHARLVPSAEILNLQQGTIGDLREGCNDRWLQAIEFIPKIPQPDRTVAFRASVFTDLERQKLGVQPGVKSLYAACDGMLFPFFTCEVKAGSEGLATAKRANANSMVIAMRGVVDLFHRAGIKQRIHRKILAISMVHNASTVELYGHYPEVLGPKTSFYQFRLRAFDYGDEDGKERYTSYKFVRNVYTKFATRHLEQVREAISKLKLVPSKPVELPGPDADVNYLTPTVSDSGETTAKSGSSSGRGLSQKALISKLQQDFASVQKEMERQRQDFQKEMERQRQDFQEREKEAKEREKRLLEVLSARSGTE